MPGQLQVRTRRTHLVTYQLPRRGGQWHRKQTRPLGIQQTVVRPGVDRVADIPDQATPLTDKCLERLDRIRSQLGDVQHQDALKIVETVSVEKIGSGHDGLVSRRLWVGRKGQRRKDPLLVRRITLDHQHAVGRCHFDRQVADVVGTQTVTRQPHLDTVLARHIKRDFERSLDRLPRLDPLESHLQRQTLPVDTHRQVDAINQRLAMIRHRRRQPDWHPSTGHLQLATQMRHRQVGMTIGNRPDQVHRHTVLRQNLDLLDQPRAVLPVGLPEVRDNVQVLDSGRLLGQKLSGRVETVGEIDVAERTLQRFQSRLQLDLKTAVDSLFEVVRPSQLRKSQYGQTLSTTLQNARRHQSLDHTLRLGKTARLVPLVLHRRRVV